MLLVHSIETIATFKGDPKKEMARKVSLLGEYPVVPKKSQKDQPPVGQHGDPLKKRAGASRHRVLRCNKYGAARCFV